MTVVCVCVRRCGRRVGFNNIQYSFDAVKDKLADERYHPTAVYSEVFDTVKTLNSINAIHHSGDTVQICSSQICQVQWIVSN